MTTYHLSVLRRFSVAASAYCVIACPMQAADAHAQTNAADVSEQHETTDLGTIALSGHTILEEMMSRTRWTVPGCRVKRPAQLPA